MEIVTAKMSHLLNLGRQGEHLARRVRFTEPAAWAAAYGAGTAQLLVCRPGEAEPYPAAWRRSRTGPGPGPSPGRTPPCPAGAAASWSTCGTTRW